MPKSSRPLLLRSSTSSVTRKLNGNRVPRRGAARRNASIVGATSQTPARSANPLSKELRLRDRDHLKFVSTQPCLACGRNPSDAHHLKFAQQPALGRKVSDEFTVPLCRATTVNSISAATNAYGGNN